MAVKKRKLNVYQQKVRGNALALQKQANAQNRARIVQSNTAANDALSFNTKQNEQALKNSNDSYKANLSGMTGRVQDEAVSQGNARGSYTGDYVRASAERRGYNRDMALAQQSRDNTADSLGLQQEQNTRNYQNALNEYTLELQRQKNEDWANTHYNYTAPKPKLPKDPVVPTVPTNTGNTKQGMTTQVAIMQKRLYDPDTIEGQATGLYGNTSTNKSKSDKPQVGSAEWKRQQQKNLRSRTM